MRNLWLFPSLKPPVTYLLSSNSTITGSRSEENNKEYKKPFIGNLRYAMTSMAIINSLAILPFYLPMLGIDFRVMRVLRIFRLFRVFKIARYVKALRIINLGDVYPVTGLGKLLGGIIAILGVGLFALPAGLLASGFSEHLSDDKKGDHVHEEKGTCPHWQRNKRI